MWISPFVYVLCYLLTRRVSGAPDLLIPLDSSGDCSCGTSEFGTNSCGGRQGRVIGGREVKKNEIPWQVSVESCSTLEEDEEEHCQGLCGGSIIGRRTVLTAAHCFHIHVPNLRVVLGTVDLRRVNPSKRVYKVASIEMNEHWDPVGAKGDIAILKLKEDIEFSDSIRPICLPSSPEESFLQKSAIVSGWGYTSEDSIDPSPTLRRAMLYITSNDDSKCRNTDPKGHALPKEYLCAHGVDADACHMDSGGPLSVSEGDRCSLAGIISYGRGCAREEYAGVYTRISQYLDWIRLNTKDDDCLNRT